MDMADEQGIERKKHPEKALSAAEVRTANEAGRYTDGGGLYLIVDESGAKRWILRTVIHGKRRDLGLGGLRTVSLAEAREEAARLRKIARAGGDPLAERRKERRVIPTFEEAARLVHEAHSKPWRNAQHKAQWISTLETYIFPVFGSRRLDHIESADVLKALSPIWMDKPETARRVRQRVKTVFEWAKASGFRSGDNPVEGVSQVLPKHETKQEHHAALPYGDLPAFIQQLRVATAALSVKLAFEFLILTASRTSEVLKAKWNEIDFVSKTWTVPAARMKAKVDHKVPLSARCLEILESAKDIADGGDYIFPGRSPKKHLSQMACNMALRRMERTEITPHGFRSTFRDWAEEKTNFPNNVVEAALAHTIKNKVEAAYLRTKLLEKRKDLMKAWSAFATAAPVAKVVRMVRA
jgi:integrase